MIDQRLVGAIVRGDLSGYHLNENDARLIFRQRVATPVHALVQSQPAVADDPARSVLDHATRRAIVSSMLQAATSNRISDLLANADVPSLVYKGVAMSAAERASWRGRESADVDVIIDPTHVTKAHRAMALNGLTRVDGKQQAPTSLFRYHDIEMAYRGLPTTVDLHWRLESPGYLDISFPQLWDGRRRVSGDGLNVWTLGSAESALVSAVHGTREGWRTLRHMLDASSQLARMTSNDWTHVTQLAASCGASKSLAVALAVADSCEVQPLPARPGPWARSVANGFLTNWAASLASAKAEPATTPTDAIHRRVDRWRLAPKPSAALDSLTRSVLRQILHKRSWTWTEQLRARHD